MRENLVILPIQPKDNAEVKGLIVAVLEGFGIRGEGFACADPELDDLQGFYNNSDRCYLIAWHNGKMAGGAGIAPLAGASEEICELQKMYLLPQYRGKGIGQALMSACMEFAISAGFRKCYLETVEAMEQAQKLYSRNGFEYISHRMGDTGHNGCPVFMLKDL